MFEMFDQKIWGDPSLLGVFSYELVRTQYSFLSDMKPPMDPKKVAPEEWVRPRPNLGEKPDFGQGLPCQRILIIPVRNKGQPSKKDAEKYQNHATDVVNWTSFIFFGGTI